MAEYFEPYIDADGVHVPTYSEILEYLTERYKAIFGEDVYLGEETPDYQLLSTFAKCVNDYSTLAVEAYNARSPHYASGNSLDILVRLAGLTRREATYSTAVLTVTGDEGTIIPIMSKAIDQNGNLWEINTEFTIPAEGYGDVNATCTTAGAVVALAGTISGIYTPTPGWTEVTNAADATVGRNTETDAELRNRFSLSHSKTNSGVYASLVTGLLEVDGVTFADIIQNDTGTTDANGIPGHSICAIVDGGDPDEIAAMIFSKKAPGVGTYGSVTKTVVDEYGHSNTVKFSVPTPVTTSVTVSITAFGNYDSSRINPIIKNAIIADVNSLGIGKSWTVTMGYKDIYSQFSGDDLAFTITGISATNTHGTSTSVADCGYDEILVTDEEHITLNVT